MPCRAWTTCSPRFRSRAGADVPEVADKTRRHRAIREVVRDQVIESQRALRKALRTRGLPATQATLSRDLRELRIARVPVDGGYRYQAGDAGDGGAPGELRLGTLAVVEVTGVESNETCVIVRTLVGRAQGVAVWLDRTDLNDLLATVAGDDTILVMPRSVKHVKRLRRALEEVLGLE